MKKINRPNNSDAPSWCLYFFDLVKEDDLIDALGSTKESTLKLIDSIPPLKENYSYAPGKWTLKTVFSHLNDCERYYAFYAMTYSRKDNIPIPNMSRDLFGANDNSNSRTLKDIGEEYLFLREATIKLFGSMTDDMLDFKSSANDFVYTPRSLGWMIAGHNIHHLNLIREKYL
ncbi:MAG: DinB family protein [Ignavibacteriaceae bacterium]